MPVSKLCVFTIYLVTDKTVSWDWSGCFSICTILAVATATVEMHIYFAFYWDILMLREANWSRAICKNCRFFGRWKTSGGHFDSRLGHVNSSASIRRGVDCFTVSKLQRGSSSFNCSVRLADLIRTTNAMVILFSLAEFSLSRRKQMRYLESLKICRSSDVNRRFIYFIRYDMTPR